MLLSKEKLAAYEASENIGEFDYIKSEKSNFKLAFYVLPRQKRIALTNIYIFCSYIDDIVDSGTNTEAEVKKKQQRLENWKTVFDNMHSIKHNSVLFAIKKIIEDYDIPMEYFKILIDGVKRDLFKNRYETFDELLEYCYGVASIVGLICTHIFGNTTQAAKEYAINLGYALQLTNIMRDVSEDFSRNYIYIPQEDLKKFNYSEEDIKEKIHKENFVQLMQLQSQRAKKYYNIANASLKPEFKNIFSPAEIMKNIYYQILTKIIDNNYDVYSKKIKLTSSQKISVVLKTLMQ